MDYETEQRLARETAIVASWDTDNYGVALEQGEITGRNDKLVGRSFNSTPPRKFSGTMDGSADGWREGYVMGWEDGGGDEDIVNELKKG